MKLKHSDNRCGFSRWELLVVLAVLALLTALLLPALFPVERKAHRINCVNNLKQIGTAVRLWAGDNGDRTPDRVPLNEGGVADTNATKAPAWAAWRFFQVMSNELNTPKLVLCPEDRARSAAGPVYSDFQSDGQGGRFGNLALSYFVGCGTTEDRPQMLLSGDRNIYGPITEPNSNDGYGNSPTNGSGSCVVFGANRPTRGPLRVGWTTRTHRNQGNVVFADGSVQQLTSRKLVEAINNTGDTNTVPGANTILFP